MRVCRSATRLPTVMVSTATTATSAATPPSLEAVDKYAATGSGAPSYVAGAQACSGTAATLNAKPITMSETPTVASGANGAMAGARSARCSAPVAAYSRAAPTSETAVETTLITKNVTAAEVPAVVTLSRG